VGEIGLGRWQGCLRLPPQVAGKGHLRGQQKHRAPQLQATLGQLQVDVGLAAARYPMHERHARGGGLQGGQELVQGGPLLRGGRPWTTSRQGAQAGISSGTRCQGFAQAHDAGRCQAPWPARRLAEHGARRQAHGSGSKRRSAGGSDSRWAHRPGRVRASRTKSSSACLRETRRTHAPSAKPGQNPRRSGSRAGWPWGKLGKSRCSTEKRPGRAQAARRDQLHTPRMGHVRAENSPRGPRAGSSTGSCSGADQGPGPQARRLRSCSTPARPRPSGASTRRPGCGAGNQSGHR
jgi:hypothetical protein